MVAKYDVVIVGAGILGMSTAYHLKQINPDLSILILDQNARGAVGNTSKSAALFRNVYTSPINRVLASASIAFYRKLQKEEGIDLGLRYTGYLWLCDESAWKQFQVLRLKEKQFGNSESIPEVKIDLEDFPLDKMVELFGCDPQGRSVSVGNGTSIKLPALEHGIFAPDCGTLAPSKLFSYYEDKFKALGGEVLYRTKVEKIMCEISNNGRALDTNAAAVATPKFGVEQNLYFDGLRTNDGIIKTDKICLAAGTWTNLLTDPLGIDMHIKSKKRQLFNIAMKQDSLPKGFVNKEERFPVFIFPPDGVFLKPLRLRGNFIAGWADELCRSFEFEEEPQAEPDFFERYIQPVLTAYLPWLADAKIKHLWAGQYHYNTLDGNPFISSVRNLTMVVGASGSGIMKADAIGKLTANKIIGDSKPQLFQNTEFPLEALGFESRLVQKEYLII